MGARKTDPDDVLPLVRLVRDRVAVSGLTLRSFAQERGVKYGTLRRIYDKNLQPLAQGLKPETLKTLATALDVPLSQVQRAHDASVGRVYKMNAAPNVEMFLASLQELTPQQRARTKAELLRLLSEID